MFVGLKIKEARIAQNITQVELAKRTGIDDATLRKYENGQMKNPKPATLIKIAKGLGINPNVLLAADTTFDMSMHQLFQLFHNYSENSNEFLTAGEIAEGVKNGSIDKDTPYITFTKLVPYMKSWLTRYKAYIETMNSIENYDKYKGNVEATKAMFELECWENTFPESDSKENQLIFEFTDYILKQLNEIYSTNYKELHQKKDEAFEKALNELHEKAKKTEV